MHNEQTDLLGRISRYGFLTMSVLLLVYHIYWRMGIPRDYPYERNGIGLVAVMLILNNLAFQFAWPKPVSRMLQIAAISWIGFCGLYLLLSR